MATKRPLPQELPDDEQSTGKRARRHAEVSAPISLHSPSDEHATAKDAATMVDVACSASAKSDGEFGATGSSMCPIDARWQAECAAAAAAVDYARASAVTAQLVQTCYSQLPMSRKMRELIGLLEEDATRPTSALDLSHVLAEKHGSVLMILIRSLSTTVYTPSDSAVSHLEKQQTMLSLRSMLPHLCALIRSSYDCSLLCNGSNTLHLLTDLCVPLGNDSWPAALAAALLDRAPDDLDRRGGEDSLTPLLRWSLDFPGDDSRERACGPLLLLARGANLEARDSEGRTALHHLLHAERFIALAEVLEHISAETLAAVRDGKGIPFRQSFMQTASSSSASRTKVEKQLDHLIEWWQRLERPARLHLLSDDHLIPDVAHLVLSYLDGCERDGTNCSVPAVAAAAPSADDNAAAAPASATSTDAMVTT